FTSEALKDQTVLALARKVVPVPYSSYNWTSNLPLRQWGTHPLLEVADIDFHRGNLIQVDVVFLHQLDRRMDVGVSVPDGRPIFV
ncbi:hypothetical protein ACC870_37805, partial [Rhizobium ruizarguesonis]